MTHAGRPVEFSKEMLRCNGLAPFRGRAQRGGVGLGLLAFLVFIGAMGALVWMLFLPHLVAWRLEARTGFPTRIERLAANPLTGTLRLEGLVMENPAGFEPRTFMAVNVLAADLRLTALLRRELVFETVELDLARVSLVTRRDGTNNLGLLHEAWRAGGVGRDPGGRPDPGEARSWLVRRLDLRLGTIEVVNHAANPAEQREFVLNHSQTMNEVTSVQQVLTPELLRRLPGLGGVVGWLRTGTGLVGDLGRLPWAGLNSLFRKLEESAQP